jgi:predicted nicotinamide N-methyase
MTAATFLMPETASEDIGHVKVDTFRLAGRDVKLSRPAEPERLLDLGSVADAYSADQYMPYWAALWPVSKYLAAEILSETWAKPDMRAIELGCGLGLPGVAAGMAGLKVTFSDYDASAVKFALENARLNGVQNAVGLLLDWRSPPPELFDVIIASDLIYEERNIKPLVALFQKILAPDGIVLLADQDRPYAKNFQKECESQGFTLTSKSFVRDLKGDQEVTGTVYRIRWIR